MHADDPAHGGRSNPPADLSHAGAVVDKAIEYMMEQNISSMAIATSLLGGAMGLLSRTMTDDAILQVLANAMASVKAGELRDGDPNGGVGPGTA